MNKQDDTYCQYFQSFFSQIVIYLIDFAGKEWSYCIHRVYY